MYNDLNAKRQTDIESNKDDGKSSGSKQFPRAPQMLPPKGRAEFGHNISEDPFKIAQRKHVLTLVQEETSYENYSNDRNKLELRLLEVILDRGFVQGDADNENIETGNK